MHGEVNTKTPRRSAHTRTSDQERGSGNPFASIAPPAAAALPPEERALSVQCKKKKKKKNNNNNKKQSTNWVFKLFGSDWLLRQGFARICITM